MANEKRLIDADGFGAYLMGKMGFNPANAEMVLQWMDEYIKQNPTVDAVEVVHGEWLDGGAIHNGKEVYKSIDCSHCEEVFKIESHDREYWKARFKVCPFCGAVMDGERKDNERKVD